MEMDQKKRLGEIMTREEYRILVILLKLGARSPGTGRTCAELQAGLKEAGGEIRHTTLYKHLASCRLQGWTASGIPAGRAATYYVTEAGNKAAKMCS